MTRLKHKSRSSFGAVVAGVMIALLLGGGAIASMALPRHSVGWNKLTLGVQKRLIDRIPGSTGPQGAAGQEGEIGPEGPPGVLRPQCDLVQGDCLIYSTDYWRLREAFKPFEIGAGAYPEPPFCMKAAMEGEGGLCPQVMSYLYPDGTVGDAPWELDPNEPAGWRLY